MKRKTKKSFLTQVKDKVKAKAKKHLTAKKKQVNSHVNTAKKYVLNKLSGDLDKPKKLSKGAINSLKVLAKAEQLIWNKSGWGLNELKDTHKVGMARVLLIEVIEANGYSINLDTSRIYPSHK